MSTPAERLELVRRTARDVGVPLDAADALALPIPRAAKLVGITAAQFRKLLAVDRVPVIDLGRNCDAIDVVDLVAFIDRRKRKLPEPSSPTAPRANVLSNAELEALERI